MSFKKINTAQLIRHLFQLAAFFLFPGLFMTVFSALQDIVTALATASFSLAGLLPQLVTVLAVFLITALWGRFFCGYLCLFGTMQELTAALADRLFPRRRQIPARVDRILKLVKYAVVLFIIVFIWILGHSFDSSLSPWNAFGLLISGNFSGINSVGFILLAAIIVASFFIERFFCRYLCPLGALFSLVSRNRLYRIKRNKTTCANCGACSRKCAMGINITSYDTVKSGECIDCMKCLPVCHFNCLQADPQSAIAGSAASLAICGLVYAGSLIPSAGASVSPPSAEENTTGQFQNGTYTGTGQGYKGNTTISVTVANGFITDITVISYQDDSSFFSKAQTGVISSIISSQTVDVDTVSGATYSSKGIINAVINALQSDSSSDAGSDSSSNDSTSTNPDDSAPAATSFAQVADGIYQGSGTGLRGTTVVTVTVKSGAVTAITIVSYQDDEKYFSRAETAMISGILTSQSLDVDTVSGATYSSSSILQAVADALDISYEVSLPANGGSHSGPGSRH